jgi:hypothetical protein
MNVYLAPGLSRAAAFAIGGFILSGAPLAAVSQTSSNSGSVQLTTWTAPDNSASAGVPSGWKAEGAQSTITLAGPQGESIILGHAWIARNGSFQAGQKGVGGSDLTMPYNASLTQKLIMVFQQGYALAGKPAPQITFTSTAPIQVPAMLGQCGRFVASLTSGSQPQQKIMGIFCSFPLDSGGMFKNLGLIAQAPAAIADQEASLAQAVFSSYRVPQAILAKILAPVTAPMPPPGNPGMSSALWGLQQSNIMATCFDEGVIRQYGPWQLPVECGGYAPNP